jgi:hypothetical protein
MTDLITFPDTGERLTLDEYRREFWELYRGIEERDSWKLERRQDFQEHNSPSWDAARAGDWVEALRLINARSPELRAQARDEHARGHFFHRIRIVEQPLSRYMRWQLESQRQRDECGERIRVMDVTKVRPLETRGPLPELVALGGTVLYEVTYRDDGYSDGAIRHTDPATVTFYETFIRGLYAAGEDIQTYHAREVAHLPPPPAQVRP